METGRLKDWQWSWQGEQRGDGSGVGTGMAVGDGTNELLKRRSLGYKQGASIQKMDSAGANR